MSGYDIAQLNFGRTVAPLDDPRLAGFVTRLDDASTGSSVGKDRARSSGGKPEGMTPDIDDAVRRLRRLAEIGPTPDGFSFKRHFPPPSG